MDQNFRPNVFWLNIIERKKHLNQYFSELYRCFGEMLHSLLPEELANRPQDKTKRKDLITFIGRDKGLGLGHETLKCAREVNKTLNLYCYKRKEYCRINETNVYPDDVLVAEGFSEDVFKRCLLKMSWFICDAYRMKIPGEVSNFCEGVSEKDDNIPMSEIQRISEEYVRNNYARYYFPFVVVIDNALYMANSGQLNKMKEAFHNLYDEIFRDDSLKDQMQMSLTLTGNGPRDIIGFDSVTNQIAAIEDCSFEPFGQNMMAATINSALDALEERLGLIMDTGSQYYKPWVLILSNGYWLNKYNGNIEEVAKRLRYLDDQDLIDLKVLSVSNVTEDQKRNLRLLSPDAGLAGDMSGFFKDVFSSLQRSKYSSPANDDVDLPGRKGFE